MPGSNAIHLRVAVGVRVLAARAFEGALIIAIALVDVDDPERHPAMRAERASVRRLKRRATLAVQWHAFASSGLGESAPPLGL